MLLNPHSHLEIYFKANTSTSLSVSDERSRDERSRDERSRDVKTCSPVLRASDLSDFVFKKREFIPRRTFGLVLCPISSDG